MRNRSKIRSGVSYVLAFFLSLFVAIFSAFLVLQTTVLSESFMQKQVDRSDYAANVIERIENTFISYGMSSGFDEAFFSSVLDEQSVREDIRGVISALYLGKPRDVSTDEFSAMLYDKLLDNVTERGFTVTEELEQSLEKLVEYCTVTYRNELRFPMASLVATLLQKAKTPVLLGIGLTAALSLFVLFVLFSIHPRKSSVIRHVIYALSGSFLMLFVPSGLILLSGRIERLAITSKPLYYLVTTELRQTIYAMLLACGILAIIVAGLGVWYHFMVRRKSHSHEEAFRVDQLQKPEVGQPQK